jgi:hypothetical protein
MKCRLLRASDTRPVMYSCPIVPRYVRRMALVQNFNYIINLCYINRVRNYFL